MLKLKMYTRFDSNSCKYLDICREEWEKFVKCYDELIPYFSGDDWTEKARQASLSYLCHLDDQKWNHLIKAVTFGAMCLEAFIYDYAAHNFSDTYVKRYLDKLDLVSKWVVIPKLTLGKDFPTESKAFEDLGKLIKVRNNFVHAKSIPMPRLDDEELEELLKKTEPLAEKDSEIEIHFLGVSAYETVIEVLTELRKLESDDIATQWWQLEELDEQKQ